MIVPNQEHIFFVDDEPRICKEISESLKSRGLRTSCFTNPFDCLKEISSHRCDLLITDLKMPSIDGIGLMREAKLIQPWLPVLIITGYGDIPTSVMAIKAGAIDFLEKPLELETFFYKIKSILKQNHDVNKLMNRSLTKTEIKILKLVLKGLTNKDISHLLDRSKRTVETHRANIMRKFCVDNTVDLIKKSSLIGLVKLPENYGLE